MDPQPGSRRGRRAPRPASCSAAFAAGGAFFFDALLPAESPASADRDDYVAALWHLVWAGLVTGDTFAAVRNRAAGGAHRRPGASGVPQPSLPAADCPGSAAPDPDAGRPVPTTAGPLVAGPARHVRRRPSRLATELFVQLDRYGVLTRGSVLTEDLEGGFGTAYRALSSLEESGQCRRGYFVEGLGAAQFALPGAVDRLRGEQREPEQAAGRWSWPPATRRIRTAPPCRGPTARGIAPDARPAPWSRW